MSDFAKARHNMVENQLRPSRIEMPALLVAMATVPREIFLPKRLRAVAYQDEDLDLGGGRHQIEPLALAKLVQAGLPRKDEVALVIGCDTGYCAAVLSPLCATVFHLAATPAEAEPVETVLEELGCDNVVVQAGPLVAGLPAQAPFGLILIAGSLAAVPDGLARQLEDGGRLVCVLREGRAGKVTVVQRVADAFGRTAPFDAAIPALHALDPVASFSF